MSLSLFKKAFAVLLAAFMLAGAMPLGVLARQAEGTTVEVGEYEDEYTKSYYDPADYEDGDTEAAPAGVITPFADGKDPVHINMEQEERTREPIEVPIGDCDYSLLFGLGGYVAYHSDSALLSEVTAALNTAAPTGIPWTDDPEHIAITQEGSDWRITVPEFFEPVGDEGSVIFRDSEGMDWRIDVRCGYPVHYIYRSFDYDTGTYSEELAYALEYGSVAKNMSNGWYALDSNKTFGSSDCVTINGVVNLILCDGYTLTANDGIYVTAGSVLNIWGQQSDSGRTFGPVTNAYTIERFWSVLTANGRSVTVEGVNIFAMYEDAEGDEDMNCFTFTAVLVGVAEANYDTVVTAVPYLEYSYEGESDQASGESMSSSVNGALNG